MKKNVFLIMFAVAAIAFAACSKDLYNEGSDETTSDPPTFAASNKIWTIGEQVWSDAIHVPECNKADFEDSDTDPQCRSYTEGSNTWYYYNWPYVYAHAARLCPSPWRVPDPADVCTLYYTLSPADCCSCNSPLLHEALVTLWGGAHAGTATGRGISEYGEHGLYWFWQDPPPVGGVTAIWLSDGLHSIALSPGSSYGWLLRCVK